MQPLAAHRALVLLQSGAAAVHAAGFQAQPEPCGAAPVSLPSGSSGGVVLGQPELVFVGGTSTGSCDDFDLPDAPARAWRDGQGVVHLAASWATSRFGHGPSLGSVKHNCSVVFNSTMSGKNSLYADHEWILAPYIFEDNSTVMGLAHQEYHGFEHKNCTFCKAGHPTPGCVTPGGRNEVTHCWMVALTSTISTDGGFSFRHTAPPPGHLVANAPYPYDPNHSEFGYGDPSGVFKHRTDGFYYMAAASRTPHLGVMAGTVLMRTKTLADWKSWRCWNGSHFSVQFADPYAEPGPDPSMLRQHVCRPVPALAGTILSIKYSVHFNAYIATGEGMFTFPNGTKTLVFFYKISTDDTLLHWSAPSLIRPMQRGGMTPSGASVGDNYPSLLDDTATSANFEEIGKSAWMYYTLQTRRFNGTACTRPPFCRDLYRQRITFP